MLAAAAIVLGLVGFEQRPAMASQVATPTQTLSLITTVPSSTTVGAQIFANVNLMNTGVTPTGTVTFRLYGPLNTACALVAFTSTVPVTGTSVNSEPFGTTVAGIYRWTTSYSGDDNYFPAGPTPCYTASAQITVGKVRSVLRLKALAPLLGKLVATATLSGYEPNGPITFLLFGPGDVFCSRPPVLTATVAANGTGSYNSPPFRPTLAGTYQWRVTYSGDNDNLGSSTGCMNEEASVLFVL